MKGAFWILGGLLALLFLAGGYWATQRPGPPVQLPYFGPSGGDSTKAQEYVIPDFTFTDQLGRSVTKADVAGKIFVADFFFTTCGGICPIMSQQLKRVAQAMKNEPKVMFLSHTVNPEYDSVEVLKAYADRHQADHDVWRFVTGSTQDLYTMARKGYFIDDANSPGYDEDFVHTENFALIDTRGHIRGYYNGIDSVDVDRLIKDIRILLKE